MRSSLPSVQYKRIRLRSRRSVNWRKLALVVMAVLVIASMIVVEILALLPATP